MKPHLHQKPPATASETRRNQLPELEEFHYRIDWRSHSAVPGHHLSTQSGGGYEFHGHAPLISNPDPRNIDIHASLHDPFGQYVVRTFRQRSSIPVYVIADLSASMGLEGQVNKMKRLAGIVRITAYSAYRTGDPFGFAGFSDSVHRNLMMPLRWQKGISGQFLDELRTCRPVGKSVNALLEAHEVIGKQPSLLFMISDFHFPFQLLQKILQTLSRHDVVPVVLWDSDEINLPRWGLSRVYDAESRQERLLFLRPRLQKRIKKSFEDRRVILESICEKSGRRPFFVNRRFCPEDMTHYFFRY